jgi:hypothetical protein
MDTAMKRAAAVSTEIDRRKSLEMNVDELIRTAAYASEAPAGLYRIFENRMQDSMSGRSCHRLHPSTRQHKRMFLTAPAKTVSVEEACQREA